MPQVTRTAGEDGPGGDAPLLNLLDILGRRWALRVVWELRAAPLTYRQLAAAIPGMSTSVLTQRLRDLRIVRLVTHERGQGYRLTDHGRDLAALLRDLAGLADRVGFDGLRQG